MQSMSNCNHEDIGYIMFGGWAQIGKWCKTCGAIKQQGSDEWELPEYAKNFILDESLYCDGKQCGHLNYTLKHDWRCTEYNQKLDQEYPLRTAITDRAIKQDNPRRIKKCASCLNKGKEKPCPTKK